MSSIDPSTPVTLGQLIPGLAQMSAPDAMAAVGNYMMAEQSDAVEEWIETLQGNVDKMSLTNELLSVFTEVQKEVGSKTSGTMADIFKKTPDLEKQFNNVLKKCQDAGIDLSTGFPGSGLYDVEWIVPAREAGLTEITSEERAMLQSTNWGASFLRTYDESLSNDMKTDIQFSHLDRHYDAVTDYALKYKVGRWDIYQQNCQYANKPKTLPGGISSSTPISKVAAFGKTLEGALDTLRNQNSMDMTKMKSANDLLDAATDFSSNTNKQLADSYREIVRGF